MEQQKVKQAKYTQPNGVHLNHTSNGWREIKDNIEAMLQGRDPPYSDTFIQETLRGKPNPPFETVSSWLNSGPQLQNTKEGIKFKAKAQAYCERLKILDLRANLGASLVNKAMQRSFHPAASLSSMQDWGKLEKALHLEVFEAEMRASRDPDDQGDEESGSINRHSHADETGNQKGSTTPSHHSNCRESLLPDAVSQATHRELPPIEELLTEVDPCTTEKKRNPHMDILLPSMAWHDEDENQAMRSSKKFTQSFSANQILQYPNPREKVIKITESAVTASNQFTTGINASLYLGQPNHKSDFSGHEMQKIERALFRCDSDRALESDRELRVSLKKSMVQSHMETNKHVPSIRELATQLQQRVGTHYFPNPQHQDILSRLLDNFFQVLELAEGDRENSPQKHHSMSNTNQKLGSNHKGLKASINYVETGKFAASGCNRKLSREKMMGGNDSFSILTRNLPGIEKLLGCSPKWKGTGYQVMESPNKTKNASTSQLSSQKRNPLQPVCSNSYIENEASRATERLNSLSPSKLKEQQHSIYGTNDAAKDISSDCLDLSVLKNHNFSVDLISAFQ